MSQPAYIDPLSRRARLAVLAAVIFFHVGIGWALTSVQPGRLMVGGMSSMEVSIVPAETLAPPDVKLDVPVPEETPPPEVPQLESMIQPPLPDLPPPTFPVEAPPRKPQPPKPPPPKPAPPKVQQAAPAQPAPPAQATAPAGPQPISLAQLAYCNPPNPIYPARSRRAGEQGTVILRVVVDPRGALVQVTLARSSGHPALDESAISAMRAACIRPLGRLVVVDAPITFNLR